MPPELPSVTNPVNTEAAPPSAKVTVWVNTTGPVMARPLLAPRVLENVAPPEFSVRAADPSLVRPSALTAPVNSTRPLPAATVSWLVPPASVLAKVIGELLD